MCAKRINRRSMTTEELREYYAILKDTFGAIYADALLGPAYTTKPVRLDITADQRNLSRQQCVCAQCASSLPSNDLDKLAFTYQGEVSFYLCASCRKEVSSRRAE